MTETAPEAETSEPETTEPAQPALDVSAMTDAQVIAARNDLIAEAETRLAAMNLRNDTVDFARKAKDLGRTRPEVEFIIGSVLDEVYAEPEPEPEFPETPESEQPA